MPETRKVEQYKVYTLHALVVKVLGKKDDKEVTRTDRVPVAVFDDAKKLAKFEKENKAKLKGQKGYETVEDWVEVKPEAGNFTVPFNPVPNASQKEEATKDNGTD